MDNRTGENLIPFARTTFQQFNNYYMYDGMVYSPYALTLPLAILLIGSNGQCQYEVANALQIKPDEEFFSEISKIKSSLESIDPNSSKKRNFVTSDTVLLVQKGVQLKDCFANRLKEKHLARIIEKDFAGKPITIRFDDTFHFNDINSVSYEAESNWGSNEGQFALFSSIRATLHWKEPFIPLYDKQEFYTSKSVFQVPIMVLTEKLRVKNFAFFDGGVDAVEVPFEPISDDWQASMYLFMPTNGTDVNSVAMTCNLINFALETDKVKPQTIQLYLPEFRSLKKESLRPFESLSELWTKKSNFSKAFDTTVYLSDLYHFTYAYVRPDRFDGDTKTIGKGSVYNGKRQAGPEPLNHSTYNFDSPFLYLVLLKSPSNSPVPIFAGTVYNPEEGTN